MRVLKIGKEEYKFQFDIEASLYSECTEKVTSIMFAIAGEEGKDAKKAFLSSLSDIPQVALHMFHAGLLENHDVTLSDSKELLKEYIKEHKEDETGSFYGVMNMLLEDMDADGFFSLIGLDKMLQKVADQAEKVKKMPKAPQDHKKKATKVTDK